MLIVPVIFNNEFDTISSPEKGIQAEGLPRFDWPFACLWGTLDC